MGYTHYWRFNSVRGQTPQKEKVYQRAIKHCQKIVSTYNKELKKENPKHYARLSGYSAHTKVGQYGGLNFNGVDEYSHEDFVLREHLTENIENPNYNPGFNFCKTAQKPYDVVVVACLIVLKHYLKSSIDVSSDGETSDWIDGLELAKRITKLKTLKSPIKEERVLCQRL